MHHHFDLRLSLIESGFVTECWSIPSRTIYHLTPLTCVTFSDPYTVYKLLGGISLKFNSHVEISP